MQFLQRCADLFAQHSFEWHFFHAFAKPGEHSEVETPMRWCIPITVTEAALGTSADAASMPINDDPMMTTRVAAHTSPLLCETAERLSRYPEPTLGDRSGDRVRLVRLAQLIQIVQVHARYGERAYTRDR